MQIQSDQLQKITRAREEESHRRLLVDLRQSSPTATSHLDDATLLATIRQATGKARGYGVRSSAATIKFVKIAVFAGLSFDHNPAIRQYLDSPELDPDYKVILLAELLAKNLKGRI